MSSESININSDDHNKVVICCEPILDIGDVMEIHRHFLSVLEKSESVEIDAGEVERIDTAVLQVFVGFIKEAELRHLPVTWSKVSEKFKMTTDLIGVSEVFIFP